MSEPYQQSGISQNAVGALTYVTLIPAIVFLLLPPYNGNPFIRFHAWQSIFLTFVSTTTYTVLSILLGISVGFGSNLYQALTSLIWIFWLLIWVLCAINALNGKRLGLPLIGAISERLARK
jgi:uncharacterized membrane protein